MASGGTDLHSLDRDVAKAASALRAWRQSAAADPESAKNVDPFGPFRHVAGQTTFQELPPGDSNSAEGPLREGLRRWVAALTQDRTGLPLELELARQRHEAAAKLELEAPRLVSYREAWLGLLASPTAAERSAWLQAAAQRGPAIASVTRELLARRLEVSSRLGIDPPSLAGRAELEQAAALLLTKTDDLARDVLRESIPGDEILPTEVLGLAVAREAPEGWPSHLNLRWLAEQLEPFAEGLRLRLPPLPEVLGASSFARALGAFGHALRVAAAPAALPFALREDPELLDAHRWSFVFASLVTSPLFHRRALGLGARVAAAQSRVLARSALVEVRLASLRLLQNDERSWGKRDRFEELTSRVLGAPLPASLAGAWPSFRHDEHARFVGLVTAREAEREMVDLFDEDWFRNPKAAGHLRERFSRSSYEPVTLGPGSLTRLIRALEESLA